VPNNIHNNLTINQKLFYNIIILSHLLQKFNKCFKLKDMKELLHNNNFLKIPKINEIVKGKIIAKEKGALFVDLGPIGTGIIYGKEFLEAKDYIKKLEIGQEVFTKIINLENEDGYLELSIGQADKDLTWQKLRELKEKGETIKIKILGANKGGLLSDFSGLLGFLPVSQLSSNNYPKVEGGEATKILKELQKFVGKEMEVQIFDIDPKSEKLIFSEKLRELEKVKEYLKNYQIGDEVEAEIVGVVDFGAFVKFGKENIDGLIHISELDWKIIENPAEVVSLGQKVKAKIIEISNGRVYLSLKALKKDPWEGIEEKYKKDDEVLGKLTKFNPFGAFVQITPEIQGLCHISEFGSQKKMKEKLQLGETYKFKILEIHPKEHRMILSLVEE